MQWYLRDEDGVILAGPGKKDEIEAMRDQVDDAIMFPETIFEPVPTSDEVELLIDELRTLAGVWEDKPEGETARKAIHALVDLSREKVVRGSIQIGLLSLEDVPEGIKVDIRDYDVNGVDKDKLQEDDRGLYFQAG